MLWVLLTTSVTVLDIAMAVLVTVVPTMREHARPTCPPTCQEVYFLLFGLHARDVLVEGGELVPRFGGVEAQQLGQALLVGRVLNHAQLQGLAELLPEGAVLAGRRRHLRVIILLILLALLVVIYCSPSTTSEDERPKCS